MRYAPVEAISKSHLTDGFDCGSEAQTAWLRRHALQADLTDSTRVQVVTRAGDRRIVGYYALSAGSVEPAEAPERIRKGTPRYPIPVIVLTRLGVDRGEQGRGLGTALLKDAILRAETASTSIGARALLVHCESPEAGDFYRRRIPDFAESPTDRLHLYLLMSDLRRTIAAVAGPTAAGGEGAANETAARDGRGRVEIRPLGAEDAESLGDLFEQLADDPASIHFHPHPLTRAEAQRIAARDGIRDDIYYVAVRDGRVVGYGMLRGWDEGYAVPSFGVAVAVDRRGAGIGRDLLRWAIAAAGERGAERMILKVHVTNVGARHVYETEGFVFEPAPGPDGQVRASLDLREHAAG